MRVVAGTARGLKLEAPDGREVRPTTDRVREAVFNALGSQGVVDGAHVLDLFAGSGAMGVEALSRGAEHCVFVDTSRAALAAAEANVERCGFADRATFVRADALTGAPLSGVGARAIGPADEAGYDLAILDPPYGFDEWDELLGSLAASVVVIESGREVEPPAGWAVTRAKSYGGTVVTIAEAVSAIRHSEHPPDGEDHS